MTMVERERGYFEPKDEISMRDKVLAGIATLPPLEVGSVISYDLISEWLDEPFPRFLPGEYGGRSYQPMDLVRANLLKHFGVLLLNVENTGYRVASDEEKVLHAERWGYLAAMEKMSYGRLVLSTVNKAHLSAARVDFVDFMATELDQEQRVMREKIRSERLKAAKYE